MNSRSCAIVVITAVLLVPIVLAGDQTVEEVTRDAILKSAPAWQENYDKYDPAQEMIDALKGALESGIRIDVYLGLWCPDSRRNVPLFIKILDRAGVAVPVQYFDVPRKANRDVKYYFEEKEVERVPTFIFYRDGKEIGRIVENPKTGMLEDTMDIVLK